MSRKKIAASRPSQPRGSGGAAPGPAAGPAVHIPREHYYEGYDDLQRFISYHHQAKLAMSLHCRSILELGVGNKTVANYLAQHGFDVGTCDLDGSLEPGAVADVRNLPFHDGSYDLVMACEILEHIPWNDFERALREIHRVCRTSALVSVPHVARVFGALYRVPLGGRAIGWAVTRVPLLFESVRHSGDLYREHEWEMGRRGSSARQVRNAFRRYFTITRELRHPLSSYHHFFVLEKP